LGFISLTDSHRVIEPVTTLIPKHQQQVGASHYAAIATFYPYRLFVSFAKIRNKSEITKAIVLTINKIIIFFNRGKI
jgi:hypothetical protein